MGNNLAFSHLTELCLQIRNESLLPTKALQQHVKHVCTMYVCVPVGIYVCLFIYIILVKNHIVTNKSSKD